MELPIFLFNKQVFNAGDMSGNLNSDILDVAEARGYCVHQFWSGAPAGNIILQGSNDGINFKAITTTAAGGASGSLLNNQPDIYYRYIQLIFTFTSGTGSLTAYISAKR